MMNDMPLLSLVLAVPLAAVALVWLWPTYAAARRIALLALLLDLALAIAAVLTFDAGQADFQFVERHDWIPSLGIRYLIGIDGISLLFLPATALLFVGVILTSWHAVHSLSRLYYSLLLVLAFASFGVFCALDTVLFYLFWELSLIPLFFLFSLWGSGPNRRHAAMKYALVMQAGGVPLLFGFLVLAFSASPIPVFDLPTLLSQPLPSGMQTLVFLLLLIGFGVKVPLVPLHTWLPLIAMEGPAAIVALITGIKLGAYGLIRFAVPLAPLAAQDLHWLLAGLGTVSLIFGAFAALAQTNLRRMLGYASLSHVGLVVLGIASFNLQGIQGAVLQLLSFTIASGGLFLLAGQLHHRTGTTDIASLGGVAGSMPLLASGFLLFGLAGMGMPGTAGFPAELLILFSAFERHTGAGLAALASMVIGATYFLAQYRRAFLGMAHNPAVIEGEDLRPRERLLMLIFMTVLLVFGFWPGLLLDIIQPAALAWTGRLH